VLRCRALGGFRCALRAKPMPGMPSIAVGAMLVGRSALDDGRETGPNDHLSIAIICFCNALGGCRRSSSRAEPIEHRRTGAGWPHDADASISFGRQVQVPVPAADKGVTECHLVTTVMDLSPALLRLCYVSKASASFTLPEVQEILKTSGANNRRDGVSGLLCYKNQCFAQVLEGQELDVLRTFVRILRDPRHTDVAILSIGAVSELMFEQWKMGYLGNAPLLDSSWDQILALRANNEGQVGELMRCWAGLVQ